MFFELFLFTLIQMFSFFKLKTEKSHNGIIGYMNANDIIAHLRRNHAGFPLLTEVAITDSESEVYHQIRRIDGLLIGKGSTRTAIEVKVSRADFKRETDEKRRAWIKHTSRFVYACPVGLIQPEEIPKGLGLWWVHPNGRIEIVKKCSVNKNPLPMPDHVFASLCYRLMYRKY